MAASLRALGPAEFPAVGDWVALDPGGDGHSVIRAVLPRVSRFARKVAGRTTEEQVLAANVDVVLLVTALGSDVNPRRLERRTDTFAARERKRQDRILNKAGQARINEKYRN